MGRLLYSLGGCPHDAAQSFLGHGGIDEPQVAQGIRIGGFDNRRDELAKTPLLEQPLMCSDRR
eukprot:10450035-Alexandrium_andersonii.AAC.1